MKGEGDRVPEGPVQTDWEGTLWTERTKNSRRFTPLPVSPALLSPRTHCPYDPRRWVRPPPYVPTVVPPDTKTVLVQVGATEDAGRGVLVSEGVGSNSPGRRRAVGTGGGQVVDSVGAPVVVPRPFFGS